MNEDRLNSKNISSDETSHILMYKELLEIKKNSPGLVNVKVTLLERMN